MADMRWEDADAVIPYAPGAKNFWRTGVVLEYVMVEHKQHKVIEVITRKEGETVEACRMYMSIPMLISKFSEELIDHHISLKKSQYLNIQGVDKYFIEPNDRDVRVQVLQDLTVQYIKSRIVIRLDGSFEVRLAVLAGDKTGPDGHLEETCEMPPTLKKYVLHDPPLKKMM